MCPGVFLCIRTVVVKTDKRLFSHGVYMINTGCQNWQTFKDRKDKVFSCGFLKECCLSKMPGKNTVFLLLKAASGKAYQVAVKVLVYSSSKIMPSALVYSPGKISIIC